MDRVFSFLLNLGVPRGLVESLRKRRGLIVLVLGILAWLPVVLVVWLFLRLLG